MTDNTDDEHLDNPTNTQSENSSDGIILTTNTDPINQIQETENMEVHKHPHHVTHKKKWGEYFLEFLMIFLAVFLGFLAENFREDIADRKKEKQFMASLIRDLKIDVNRTNIQLNLRLKRIQYCDSLLFLLTSSLIKDSGAAIYYYARNIFVIRFPFTASTGAFEQLKNSGSIRLIRNPD